MPRPLSRERGKGQRAYAGLGRRPLAIARSGPPAASFAPARAIPRRAVRAGLPAPSSGASRRPDGARTTRPGRTAAGFRRLEVFSRRAESCGPGPMPRSGLMRRGARWSVIQTLTSTADSAFEFVDRHAERQPDARFVRPGDGAHALEHDRWQADDTATGAGFELALRAAPSARRVSVLHPIACAETISIV